MKRVSRLARARPAQARADSGAAEGPVRVLTLTEMGARGDALAEGSDGPIFTPFGLPGETVEAQVIGARAAITRVASASPDRMDPACPHFGRCGGCQLQHWALGPALAWKRTQVETALRRRGFDAPVAPTIDAWGKGRRRATLHAIRAGRGVRLGFMERGGVRVMGIETCPALTAGLQAKLPALEAIARLCAPRRGEATLHCLDSETGIDVDVRGAAPVTERAQREALAGLAAEHDLARLSIDGETLAAARTPIVTMGAAKVACPPGAFLQPTALGEETLARLVLDALAGARRAADLFCGLGTFGLRLAAFAEVLAVEGDETMLMALKRAADAAGGLHGVTTQRRDLLRTPISALELKKCDAIVFDPPRSGARLQAEQIAASKAERVAAVSCDAGSFARDARALVDGGFDLVSVTPVDQFRWSPHIEIVGVFQR